jgi:hypothetical protein
LDVLLDCLGDSLRDKINTCFFAIRPNDKSGADDKGYPAYNAEAGP